MTEVHKNAALYTALNAAQKIMSGAKKDKRNPFYKSNYADLGAVFDAIHFPFAENGLSVTQLFDVLESGRTVLITHLMHISGEFIESKILLPDIADPQKLASAITYFRRFSLMSISGLPAEDDDGETASRAVKYEAAKAAHEEAQAEAKPDPAITDEQYEVLESTLLDHDELRANVLSYLNKSMKIRTLQEMPSRVYDTVLMRVKASIASGDNVAEEAAV